MIDSLRGGVATVAARLIVLSALGGAPPSHADHYSSTMPLAIAQNAPGIGPGEAAAIVEQSSGGQVLSVEPSSRDGRRVYQVKVLLPGGTVRVVRVDVATGRVLN